MRHVAHADPLKSPLKNQKNAIAIALVALLGATSAQALEIDTGNPDWKLRWDNTLKYSLMSRVSGPLPELSTSAPAAPNQNDGNNNFKRGLVSNRLDWYTELDLTGRSYGARLSAAAWYDSVYNKSTDNSGISPNHFPASEFPSDTQKEMGRKGELLDAFVYAKFDLGEAPATLRVGKHTLLWGESLFFGANGIAGGMAPLDTIKLTSVPNSTFKETAIPTGKISGIVQLSDNVSVAGYLPYEWEKSKLMPAGAYLSAGDAIGPGAERIFRGPNTFLRTGDVGAKSSGQGGLSLSVTVPEIDTDFGFYAIRYHATTPSGNHFLQDGASRTYRWLYHEGTTAVGASFSKTISEWSLGGEVSVRHNTPLASTAQTTSSAAGLNNNSNPAYAVGDTAHAQFSWLASLGPSFIAQEASFAGEVAWNKRLRVDKNAAWLNPNADESAWALRVNYSPTYRQVAPGLDVSPSIGVSYTRGKSSALGASFGPDKGGAVTLGLNAVYLNDWNIGINYVHYYGKAGPSQDAVGNPQFLQNLKDRNYLAVSVRTTF